MIIYKSGDAIEALLSRSNEEGNHTYLLHCCNAQGVMGSGIAKSIKERIPEAYIEYKHHIKESSLSNVNPMGSFSEGGNVINMIAQENYGRGKRQVHYGYLAKALPKIVRAFSSYDEERTLIVPYKMACDRAGGDWNVVVELLEVVFDGWTVEVYEL